jgi:hypothetical protein
MGIALRLLDNQSGGLTVELSVPVARGDAT